jgi:XRE family transcriptional regulator, regulator of sulfur utilization
MVKKKETTVQNIVKHKSPSSALRQAPLPPGDDVGAADLSRRVGVNLQKKRKARGLSLDQLAAASGVSRAALSQIEQAKGNPSLGVLWKIAVGLGTPFGELIGETEDTTTVLRRKDTQVLRSADGKMESRPLTPSGISPWVELYELRVTGRSFQTSEAHIKGTREIVVVLSGSLQLRLGEETYDLSVGDSIAFQADQPHVYHNPSTSEARYHNVIIYPR